MSLLGGFRADQLVEKLVAEQKPDSPSAKKLVDRLKKIGPKVIPRAIDALALSDKSHTMVLVDVRFGRPSWRTVAEGVGTDPWMATWNALKTLVPGLP